MTMSGDERGGETFLAKICKGWRITVYEPVRKYLDLEIGDLLRVTVQKDEGREPSRP